MDKISIQKIDKEILGLNSTLDQVDLKVYIEHPRQKQHMEHTVEYIIF